MTGRIKRLFAELDKYWNIVSAPTRHGEHPECHKKQSEILEELKTMSLDDVKTLLNDLSDEQLDQIVSIVEEIIEEFPETAQTFLDINSERDIHWLNDELRILGLLNG